MEFSCIEKERKITEHLEIKTNTPVTILKENKNVLSQYSKELKIGDIVWNPEKNIYPDIITAIQKPEQSKTNTTFITCNNSTLPSFSIKENGFIAIQKK